MTIAFDNSYARLPDRFYAPQAPQSVAAPGLIAVNTGLAQALGLDLDWLGSPEGVAALAGNITPAGATPIAQAYAGHQFGGWSPQLGDGRAVLLGEIIAPDGRRFDMALKGSGQTPFSRRGDGRAWVGPVLREYILSEAMAALGVPTTRALAAVTTGEVIWREQPRPGAVLTRIAASHIRVGTFQYFAAREDIEALRLLTGHVIARHYPGAETPVDLLDAVVAAQARLIARWMSIGFIHGVMNTDNMAISGETIDYGPCAFMDAYDPAKVFSSIDAHGRYAYGNQPNIAVWNLAQLASCLLPLMGDEGPAIAALTTSLHRFAPIYEAEWLRLFRAKIGLTSQAPGDAELIETLLTRMAAEGADFTRTFRGLASGLARAEFRNPAAYDGWAQDWQDRLSRDPDLSNAAGLSNAPGPKALMLAANPAYIPRNHRIEAAIQAAVAGDYTPFHRLNEILAQPFTDQPGAEAFALPPTPDEEVRRTFCGT